MKERFIVMIKVFFLLNFPVTILILYSCTNKSFILFNHELRKIPQIEILTLKKSNESKLLYASSEIPKVDDDIKLYFSNYKKFGNYHGFSDSFPIFLKNKFNNGYLFTQEKEELNNEEEDIGFQKTLKILLVGDSMGQGISWWFEKNADHTNIHFRSFAKQSTTTKYWYNDEELYENLKNFNPDIILISLGANEFSGNHVYSRLNILKLKQKLNQYCSNVIWILPPIEKAREYNEIVKEIFSEKKVFDSNKIELPRGKDKIHPTRSGFFQWSNIIYDCCIKDKYDNPECILNGNS